MPPEPVIAGPAGIRYDFNEGCRVSLPAGEWRVRLRDLDSDTILFDGEASGGTVLSAKKYFVRFGIEVWRGGESVFRHDYDAHGRDVLVRMEAGGLGDQIAWIGHAAAFAERHGCQVTCCVRPDLVPLLQPGFPDLRIVPVAEVDPERFYATYKVFVFYNDHELLWSPCDYRVVGLCHSAAYILGLPPQERRPAIAIEPGGPPIEGRYVCIATQASGQSKHWNNPHGWAEVIAFLKRAGYRVVCIDQSRVGGDGLSWNHIPHGAEDETGARPLAERARWLRHASFFVGLSSGLSWLAWAAGAKVVLISGFTHPMNEFSTPHRVINWHACNSCSNDIRHQLNPADFFWCPRQAGTERMFECTRLITGRQVVDAIRGVPGFEEERNA